MRRTAWSALALAVVAGGCGREAGQTEAERQSSGGEVATPEGVSTEPSRVAIARLESAPDRRVEGTVTITEQESGGLLIEANVTGLEPGAHGFHIHDVGECSPPGFESAGSHFAAEGERHAGPTDPGHHLGDLGNVEVGPNGTVSYSIRVDGLTLADDERSVAGKSVIIHADPDDYETQPTGNSGARIACGVIRPLG